MNEGYKSAKKKSTPSKKTMQLSDHGLHNLYVLVQVTVSLNLRVLVFCFALFCLPQQKKRE